MSNSNFTHRITAFKEAVHGKLAIAGFDDGDVAFLSHTKVGGDYGDYWRGE